jgi:hypothetical protein
MPGKPKDNPNKTREQETAEKKRQCVEVYATLGVKKAAAASVGRELKTINEWEAADEDFRLEMLRAESRFLEKNRHKVKLDNVFAHLFDEYKPPTQQVEQTGETKVTITYVHPHHPNPTDNQAGPDVAEAAG